MLRSTFCASVLFAGLVVATHVHAGPVKLTMTQDEPLTGRAVLTGNLLDPAQPWAGPEGGTQTLSLVSELAGGGAPINWTARANLSRFVIGNSFFFFVTVVRGQHLIAPDVGEAAPGPELTTGESPAILFDDLSARTSTGPNPLNPAPVSITHDLENHFDSMRVVLIDLNPRSNSALGGVLGDSIRMNVILTHTVTGVPLPAAAWSLLTVLGGLGLAACRQLRRHTA